jgi:predicted amidohydrolase YtcJ
MAITAMTHGAAYSAFGENEYGTIAVGQRANFTVLNNNLWGEDITTYRKSTKVLRTIVAGKSLYTAQ